MLKNCYLFYGEEEWLKTQELRKIIDQTVPADDVMNHVVFEDKDLSVQKLIDTCETMPFFATHKLVIVKESGLFKTGKKDDTQKLTKWLETIPDYVVLVFLEKEVDKRNGLYKTVHTKHQTVECTCPEEQTLKRIIDTYISENNIHMSTQLVYYFIENMPRSIHYMIGELEKLASYCMNGEVTKQAIDEVCVFSLEQRVFELLKQISKKKTTEALGIYTRMIESKESPIGVLVLIARQYRMLMQVKYLVRGHAQPPQIAKAVGVPLFVAKEMVKECQAFSFKQLQFILEACLESDIAIKTGKMEPVKCIELLIMKCIYIEG